MESVYGSKAEYVGLPQNQRCVSVMAELSLSFTMMWVTGHEEED